MRKQIIKIVATILSVVCCSCIVSALAQDTNSMPSKIIATEPLIKKLIGTWKSERSGMTATFLNDKTGYSTFGKTNVPFKWLISQDGSLKVVGADNGIKPISFVGDKLLIGTTINFFVKIK